MLVSINWFNSSILLPTIKVKLVSLLLLSKADISKEDQNREINIYVYGRDGQNAREIAKEAVASFALSTVSAAYENGSLEDKTYNSAYINANLGSKTYSISKDICILL